MSIEQPTVLIVSYYFPPDTAVGAKRIARFCKYLPDFGVRPVVLTIDEDTCAAVDRSFPAQSDLLVKRVRPETTLFARYRHARRSQQDNAPSAGAQEPSIRSVDRTSSVVGTMKSMIRRNLVSALCFPDLTAGWRAPAVEQGIAFATEHHVDAVFSSAPPWTTHLVGSAIARKLNLPWFADFRDAWASSPWRRYACDGDGFAAWRDRFDSTVEGRWLQQAALTICNTSSLRQSLLRDHPRVSPDKLAVISNGTDAMPAVSASLSQHSGPRVFLHAGSLYLGRRLDAFARAVEGLVADGTLTPALARFVFLGDVDSNIEAEARSAAPAAFARGMVEFQPPVKWEQAQAALQNADILVMVQGEHPTAVPAKFFEYLNTGKPILTIAGPGALRDIVHETKSGVVAAPDDVAEIIAAIRQVLQSQPKSPAEIQRITAQYDYRRLTSQLAQHIRTVLGASPHQQAKGAAR